MVPGRNEKTRIVERDVDERAERGATGRTRAPKAEGGRGITLGSGNTAVARLRATVVPVTESSDPSAASLPPTSSAAGASFLRARPPPPASSSSYSSSARRPPPARLPVVGRALSQLSEHNASRPTTPLPRSRNTVAGLRRCWRAGNAAASGPGHTVLSSRPSANAAALLRSTLLPLPFHHVHALLSAPAFVPPSTNLDTRRRRYSFHFEGVSLFTRRRTLIDHVFQPLIVEATFLLIRSINRTYLSLSLSKGRKKERKLVSVPGTVSQRSSIVL